MFDFVIFDNNTCKCPFCKRTSFYTANQISKAQKYGYLICNSCGSEIFEEDFDKNRKHDEDDE